LPSSVRASASLPDLVRINVGHCGGVLDHVVQTAQARGIAMPLAAAGG
jgi:hypothetical protein